MVHPGGRPLKFKSPEDMQQKIEAYFASCWEEAWDFIKDKDGNGSWVQRFDKDGKPLMRLKERPTITGLALALDTNRMTLLEYETIHDDYTDIVKKAKTLVEYYYEKGVAEGAIHPATGIFALKNFGWTDVIQVNTNQNQEQLTPNEIREQLSKRKGKG